jgi:hypothetical protein
VLDLAINDCLFFRISLKVERQLRGSVLLIQSFFVELEAVRINRELNNLFAVCCVANIQSRS